MHRKRISMVMACVLALTMTVGQGGLAFAADDFSTGQEELATEELTDAEMEDLQDVEEEMQTSTDDIDLFTDESNDAVFSAGDTDTPAQNEEQEINGAGTYTVTYDQIYYFKPAETGMYKFDFGTNAFTIGFEASIDGDSVSSSGNYTFKAEADKTYTVKVERISEEEEDSGENPDTETTTSISITKLPSIKSVTINSTLPETCEIAKEYAVGNQSFLDRLDYTFNLDDGTTVTGNSNINDYGYLWITYTDENGQEVDYDQIQPGDVGGYRFYSTKDPSVMSKVYRCNFISFVQKANEHDAVYDKNTGNLTVTLGSPYKDWTSLYSYGFVYDCHQDFEGSVDVGFEYKNVDIYELTKDGLRTIYTPDFESGKKYYIKVQADHELMEYEKVFTVYGVSQNIEATWNLAPTDSFLEELLPVEADVAESLSVLLNDNGDITTTFSGEINKKYGQCDIECEEAENGDKVYGVTFSKNEYISLSKTSKKTSITAEDNNIPAVSLDNDQLEIPRNYNNSNVFKFTAPEDGGYSFNITGNIFENYYTNRADIAYVIKSNKGDYTETRYSYVSSNKTINLNKNDTIYVATYPYIGNITVHVERKPVVWKIELANPDVIPDTLYLQFLDHNGLDTYFNEAEFNVTYIDASGKMNTEKAEGLYSEVEGFGQIGLSNNGMYRYDYDTDEVECVPGSYELKVALSEINDSGYYVESYSIGKTVTIGDLNTMSTSLEVSPEKELDLSEQKTESKNFWIGNTTENTVKYKVNLETPGSKINLLLTSVAGGEAEAKQIINSTYVTLKPNEKAYFEFWGDADAVQVIPSDIESITAKIVTEKPVLLKDVPGIGVEDLTFEVEVKNTEGKTEKYTEVNSGVILEKYGKAELQFANGMPLSAQEDSEIELKLSMPAISNDLINVDGTVKVTSWKDFFGEEDNLPGINEKVTFSAEKKYNGNAAAAIRIPEAGVYNIDVTYSKATDDWAYYCEVRHSEEQMDPDGFNGSTVMALKQGTLMLFGSNVESVIVTKIDSVKDELQKLCDECKKLKSSDYTKDSWDDLAGELWDVQEMLKAWDKYQEDDFVYELNKLKNLKDSLVLAPKPTPNPYPYYPDPVATVTPTPTATPMPTATPTPSPEPTETPKPVGEQKPVISTAKANGNKVHAQLKDEIENAEGYDFVLCASKSDFKSGKYLDTRKNLTEPEVYFSYVPKGTYYVYCHAWNYVDGKKVYSKWSSPNRVKVVATTVAAPKISSVKVKGRTVTIKLSRDKTAAGVDLVLGKSTSKDQYGKRPVNYGKLVKKNKKGTTITFTNVPKGTYYIGAHAFNRSATDKSKVFSQWSNIKKIVVK